MTVLNFIRVAMLTALLLPAPFSVCAAGGDDDETYQVAAGLIDSDDINKIMGNRELFEFLEMLEQMDAIENFTYIDGLEGEKDE